MIHICYIYIYISSAKGRVKASEGHQAHEASPGKPLPLTP